MVKKQQQQNKTTTTTTTAKQSVGIFEALTIKT